MTSSSAIRKAFLDFFHKQGHEVVSSSSLVPGNDPTLLFTNAGMVQFKDTFLGLDKRANVRATSSQRCVRAGGKHNDLENVGYTARHHTFFEMLGNFSFGDYFKREAIAYAWEFLTVTLKLPAERLWITVYEDDTEAADIWLKEMKVSAERFSRLGKDSNFWSMGDTGPCGPCSEIFYDHGADIFGGPPGSPDEDGDRYVEIWNLVFMQFDRDAAGNLKPLPKPSVDTGMGLERLAAVIQGVHSNYDIDLFQHLLKAAATLANTSDLSQSSLKVIADHIRSCAFLINDDVLPSNEGRGYVLRRIIRRAIRHGYKLGIEEVFFYKLVSALCDEMGEAYPDLIKNRWQIEKVLKLEEERFAETLDQGMKILEVSIANLKGTTIPGEDLFRLYDTYGFPVDLTADIARERNLLVDMEGFEKEMDAQRNRARSAGQFQVAYAGKLDLEGETRFTGYDPLEVQGKVIGLYVEGKSVDRVNAGLQAMLVLDQTPFYAESGGQVGDHGTLEKAGMVFRVQDTQKQGGHFFGHFGLVEQGEIAVNDLLTAKIDRNARAATAANHSATHLMHAALQKILGDHVKQKGSMVDAGRLRFDFAHFEPISADKLASIERLVNEQIRANVDVETKLMKYDEAIQTGAMALFGEKYGDEVRVLRMGEFSTELCGGTHVKRLGDIGLFKILSETGVASGVRRIEAVAGQPAVEWVQKNDRQLRRVAGLVKAKPEELEQRIQALVDQNKNLEKELGQLKSKLASSQGSELVSQAQTVCGIAVLAARIEGVDAKSLRDLADQLKDKLGKAVVLLAVVEEGKISLVASVTKEESKRLKAGDLVRDLSVKLGGKGGGRPDMAQGGGTDIDALASALAAVPAWVEAQLA